LRLSRGFVNSKNPCFHSFFRFFPVFSGFWPIFGIKATRGAAATPLYRSLEPYSFSLPNHPWKYAFAIQSNWVLLRRAGTLALFLKWLAAETRSH
jgi:hypothetical protein